MINRLIRLKQVYAQKSMSALNSLWSQRQRWKTSYFIV